MIKGRLKESQENRQNYLNNHEATENMKKNEERGAWTNEK
jgi:hypothetical protein